MYFGLYELIYKPLTLVKDKSLVKCAGAYLEGGYKLRPGMPKSLPTNKISRLGKETYRGSVNHSLHSRM